MKKTLTIIAIIAGVISVVAAVIAVCLYVKDITGQAKKITGCVNAIKNKLLKRRAFFGDSIESFEE